MANKILVRRGSKVNLPILDQGEFGYCTDTDEVFIGDGAANHQLALDEKVIHKDVAGEIASITEKTAPTSADKVLIEDSVSGDSKKMVQIGNLLATDDTIREMILKARAWG